MSPTEAVMTVIDKQPDTEADRTRHWAQLGAEWDKRSQFAAEWLQDAECVADVGCGLMTLERYLPRSTQYIPIDLVQRDERTIVVDLNNEPIPALSCDAVAMLGVLEYLNDVPRALAQLAGFRRAVFNYNHMSINDLLWKLKLRQRRVTWINRYSKMRIEQFIKGAGLTIVRQRKIRIGEVLYEVCPV